jgi:hypothetical protein
MRGNDVLLWMLRRLNAVEKLPDDVDLVLVREHPVLPALDPALDLGTSHLRVGRFAGELTLRSALPDADRLVAVVPHGFRPPLDIIERAWLRRILDVRADDVVAATANRFCEPLLDPELEAAVFEAPESLERHVGQWSLGERVTAAEVRSVLLASELGIGARLDRVAPADLLAAWLRDGLPKTRTPQLLRTALAAAHGRLGLLLAHTVETGQLDDLIAVGALAHDDRHLLLPGLADLWREPGAAQTVAPLVDRAVRSLQEVAPARADQVLAKAEGVGHKMPASLATVPRFALLQAVLERALHDAMHQCAVGQPPPDQDLDNCKAHRLGKVLSARIEATQDAARLARFCLAMPPLDAAGPWQAWLDGKAAQGTAWSDLALRRLRHALGLLPADMRGAADQVIQRYVAHRDALNQAFAARLAADWPAIAASHNADQPLCVAQIGRVLVRPLLDDGHRVLMVVLDGCDLSTWLEMLLRLEEASGLGLVLPDTSRAELRADLQKRTAWQVAVAALPTVTAQSRRAIFAGDIPGSVSLDDAESAAVNAGADRSAFLSSRVWGTHARSLFLKGDLNDGGLALEASLRARVHTLIGVVLNGVDDALGSHETGPLGPWSFDRLGPRVTDWLRLAADNGWTVLVTADHGHTPFVHASRKALASAAGSRWHTQAGDGATCFAQGPLPAKPLYLQWRFGSWHGTQRQGCHGGAGLEEVAVPLSFIGRVERGQGRPVAPPWWWSLDAEAAVQPAAPPSLPALQLHGVVSRVEVYAPAADAALPAKYAEALKSDRERAVVKLLLDHEVLTTDSLARLMGMNQFLLRGLVSTVQRKLAGTPDGCPIVAEGDDSAPSYRWKAGA